MMLSRVIFDALCDLRKSFKYHQAVGKQQKMFLFENTKASKLSL